MTARASDRAAPHRTEREKASNCLDILVGALAVSGPEQGAAGGREGEVWSIIRRACMEATRYPDLRYEELSAKVDALAAQAEHDLVALRSGQGADGGSTDDSLKATALDAANAMMRLVHQLQSGNVVYALAFDRLAVGDTLRDAATALRRAALRSAPPGSQT